MNLFLNNLNINMDAPSAWGIYFQDSATPQMEGLVELHDNIMYYLVVILFAVGWVLLSIVRNYIATKSPISHKYLNHGIKSVPFHKCSKINWNSLFNFHISYIQNRNPVLGQKVLAYSTLNSKDSSNSSLLPSNGDITPAVVYQDAYSMKKAILELAPENKGKSGIYMWTNKLTGDIYVGQSVDIRKRFIKYFSLSYINSRKELIISPLRALAPWAAHSFFLEKTRAGALIKSSFFTNHIKGASVGYLNYCRLYSNDASLNFESTVVSHSPIDPWFVTGFTDGEGCFSLNIHKSTQTKLGWKVQAIFSINLHKRDEAILHQIKATLGVGGIYLRGNKNSVQIVVNSLSGLEALFYHFDKYPLISQKWSDYHLFKMGVDLIKSKEHLTIDGIRKILAIRASMNNGLSDELKVSFPNIVPVSRPLMEAATIPHPFWLAGFTTAEGCFLINLIRSSAMRVGFQVRLVFTISQHNRDKQLMTTIIKYLGCGNTYDNRGSVDLVISKFKDLENKVLPIFEKYPILGEKFKDYLDFLKIIEIMKNKGHITIEGIDKITKIKAGMNKGRIFSDGSEDLKEEALKDKSKDKAGALSPSGNPVNVYEKCDSSGFKLIGSFVSPRRAGKFLDISGSSIIKYMHSGAIFKDRYKFSSR